MLLNSKAPGPGTREADYLDLDQAVFGILVVFGCIYVFDTGMGDWPAYVRARGRLHQVETSRLMFIDFVYELVLLAAFFTYRANRERYLFLAMGVLAWGGVYVALFHLILTVGYVQYAPGVISALLGFVPLTVLGTRKVRQMGRLTFATAAGAVLTGLVLFLAPYLIIVRAVS